MKKKFKLKEGINTCTNEEYHGDKRYLSSSSYKLILKDLEDFEAQFIKGETKQVSKNTQNAFDEGTYVHSLILEPDTIDDEFAFYPEWTKKGKLWEEFKADNEGKIILSKPQKIRTERWVAACKKRDSVLKIIEGGFPEHTIAGKFLGIPTKVRADYINIDKGYIVDVKTTSYSTDVDSFKHTVDSFSYDLSAALYCELFSKYYGKDFDFYFYVLGKRDDSCEVFKASEETLTRGLNMLHKAADLYKKCKKTGIWKKPEGKAIINEDADYEILEV